MMECSTVFLHILIFFLASTNEGLTLSLSVSSALSGSINEDTDGDLLVGHYYTTDEWYESSPSCSVNSPSGGLFYLSGSDIRKTSCVACLNYASASSYTVEVYCYTNIVSGLFGTNREYASMTVYISPNNPPYFTNSEYSVTVNGFMVYAGQSVYDLNWWDTDTNVNSLSVSYTAPATSHVFGNTLWNFNTGSGIITATKTMSEEFTNTYYLTVSVADRRSTVSTTVTINLNACHVTPNCTDQTWTIADTFPIGGTLFTQTVPSSGLFSGLSFSMSTSLSQAYITPSTGTITTTGNITVHPYYPSRTWAIYVTVSASGSCYTHTCTMTLTVTFTNWPIFITSLPASTTVHEDTDSFIAIHSLVTWDNNYDYQDNVTCYISSDPLTGACAGTLFQLVNNGYYNDTAFTLYKKSCNSPGCGVICDTNGCLDHDVTTSYVIGITCYDGYGSSDTDMFTMYVRQNDPPIFTNLPNSITLNTDIIARGDVLFTIYYTDTENENLRYNYTYNGVVDNNLFYGDTYGNYYTNCTDQTRTIADTGGTLFTQTVSSSDLFSGLSSSMSTSLSQAYITSSTDNINVVGNSGSESKSIATIVGAVCGTLVFISVTVVFGVVIFKQKRKRTIIRPDENPSFSINTQDYKNIPPNVTTLS